jgi:hypothetical protein
MSWYYAGPEATPIGPVSVEELHARRANGTISPETYVIEHTGQPDPTRAWKRYRELFPPAPVLPPPFVPPVPQAQPQPHPLFPSATPLASQHPVFTSPAGPDPFYAVRKTNVWCLWGFWLGLASLPLLIFCGFGALVALAAAGACLVGLVAKRPEQSGRRFALGGLVFAGLSLLIMLAFLAWAIPALIKEREQTTTEQSTNDSE